MRYVSDIPPRWVWGAIGVLLATLVLQLGFWLAQPRHRDGSWLHSQITALPDREVEPWLRGFAEARGEQALPLIVRDVVSPRKPVRRAARNILQNEPAHWRTIPPEQAARRATVIATTLRGADATSPEAAEVAGLVYAWVTSGDCPDVDRPRLLVALHGLPRSLPASITEDEPRQNSHSDESSAPAPNEVPVDEVAAAMVIQPTSTAPSTAPRIADHSSAAPKPIAGPAPQLLSPELGQNASPLDEDWNLAPRPEPSAATESDSAPAPPEPLVNEAELKQASTRELLPLLHTGGRAAAEEELRRRGFQDEQLELARHLSSPDAAERQAWTVALPRISHVDSGAWLAWMADDPDAAVRRSAVTLLATMSDEASVARLRVIAARDPDPSIRRLAAEQLDRK